MGYIPQEATKIDVVGATVDFYKMQKNGESTYYFDTSKCGPPEPMVNAMAGLRLIKGTNDKLVMINHKTPGGLFAKLQEDIVHEMENIEGGLVKVTFSSNNAASSSSNLNDVSH